MHSEPEHLNFGAIIVFHNIDGWIDLIDFPYRVINVRVIVVYKERISALNVHLRHVERPAVKVKVEVLVVEGEVRERERHQELHVAVPSPDDLASVHDDRGRLRERLLNAGGAKYVWGPDAWAHKLVSVKEDLL